MAVTAQTSDQYKLGLITKLIDLDNDSVKVLLMRDGFSFDRGKCGKLINIKTVNAGVQIDVVAAAKTFTRASGSFLTDGFIPGNEITGANFANGGNNAAFIIAIVTALVITVVTGTGLVNETGSGDETLTSDDELATGNGYTQDTKTTGTITVSVDTANHYAKATFPTVTWTASGGAIGPTPGAILYDDTTADNIVVGYIDFGGNETRATTETLDIQNGEIREV
ncbi:hypothetical protein KAR91_42210 [Candidatus Pacearchaeota archaeon]|nr:hypothetical protein [Candidatus Pacearchaeota archaeon]